MSRGTQRHTPKIARDASELRRAWLLTTLVQATNGAVRARLQFRSTRRSIACLVRICKDTCLNSDRHSTYRFNPSSLRLLCIPAYCARLPYCYRADEICDEGTSAFAAPSYTDTRSHPCTAGQSLRCVHLRYRDWLFLCTLPAACAWMTAPRTAIDMNYI